MQLIILSWTQLNNKMTMKKSPNVFPSLMIFGIPKLQMDWSGDSPLVSIYIYTSTYLYLRLLHTILVASIFICPCLSFSAPIFVGSTQYIFTAPTLWRVSEKHRCAKWNVYTYIHVTYIYIYVYICIYIYTLHSL